MLRSFGCHREIWRLSGWPRGKRAVNPRHVEHGESEGCHWSEHRKKDAPGSRPGDEHTRCDGDCDAMNELEYARAGGAKVNDADR